MVRVAAVVEICLAVVEWSGRDRVEARVITNAYVAERLTTILQASRPGEAVLSEAERYRLLAATPSAHLETIVDPGCFLPCAPDT